MTISIGVGGAWKNVPSVSVGVSGAWKTVAAIWIGVGGAWKVAYTALSVTCANVTASDGGFAASGTVQTDRSVSALPSGGSGNYTYAWAFLSGDEAAITFATSANPQWAATVSDGVPHVGAWRVTVTDTTYGVTATADITVTLDWTDIT